MYRTRVVAECTKCYSSLRDTSASDDNIPNKKRRKDDGGVLASVSLPNLDRATYWHMPLLANSGLGQVAYQVLPSLSPPAPPVEPPVAPPIAPSVEPPVAPPVAPLVEPPVAPPVEPPVTNTPTKLRSERDTTPLRCPNHCQVDQYGAVKWECSGTLDDGTGQARLFSERDSSLCLLGLSTETIELIEHGAWLNEGGIVFSKTMPPKAYLRHAIGTARYLAETDKRSFHWKKGPLKDKDVMAFLTPTARAEYLLQRHCRSLAPVRELDYFVRCKPLSDSVTHVKHTAIEIFPGNDMTTYTLPPLKLQLVDCCVGTRCSAAGEEEEDSISCQ